MMQKRSIIIVLCTALTPMGVFAVTIDIKKQEISMLDEYKFIKENGINKYIIDKHIDLHGKIASFPPKSELIFRKGMLSNGRIVGDSTEIIYTEMPIFDNIEIDGSWKIEQLSTKLFLTTDTFTLSNLSILSSDKLYNVISVDDECRIPIKPWSSYFTIKSNTDLILNADIYTLPTHYKGGYCIGISGKNIKVYGNGHFLYGTIASQDQKECPQWLHGLNIDSKSQNVIIDHLNSWLFCGDGFYNSGSNVTIRNVNAKFNGRQGLSITNGVNIVVSNSCFTYTGFYRINISKGPGAGIDIEPNKGQNVNNITIKNCILTNNYKYLKGLDNDLEIYQTGEAIINIIDSQVNSIYLGSCSNVSIQNCDDLSSIYEIDRKVGEISLLNSGNPNIHKF